MWDPPSLIVTVDWAAGMATVAVRGELDARTCAAVQERLRWVMEIRPQRLVLDLADVADHYSEQALGVIAAARLKLPPGAVLEVCSGSVTVRRELDTAKLPEVRLRAGLDADPDRSSSGGRLR